LNDRPESVLAAAVTVYDVPGSSRVPALQDVLSADILPGTAPDLELTVTELRVAWSAVTWTLWSTGTSVAPRETLLVTEALAAGGPVGAECDCLVW
jgi:hypothetical protein